MNNKIKSQADAFRNELRKLLKKYEVSLVDMSEGDTHGMYNEGLGIHINGVDIRISDTRFTDSVDLKDENQYF